MKTNNKQTPKTEPEITLPFRVKPSQNIATALQCVIVSDKRIPFSKDRAFKFLELETFQGERPVNERHVQFLFDEHSAGRFMWEQALLCECRCDGKRFRLNGQHTCWMRINIDDDFFTKQRGEDPKIRELVYQVESEEHLRSLYSAIDRNKPRTAAHLFKALLVGMKETSDLWTSTLGVLGAGMRLWLFEDSRANVAVNDIASLASGEHHNLFRVVGLYFQSHYDECPFIRRAAVIAGMFASFNVGGQRSVEFWDPVLTGLGLNDKADPRNALRNFLLTHKQVLTGGRGTTTSAEDTYRIVISSWNKWCTGDKALGGLRSTEQRQKPRRPKVITI